MGGRGDIWREGWREGWWWLEVDSTEIVTELRGGECLHQSLQCILQPPDSPVFLPGSPHQLLFSPSQHQLYSQSLARTLIIIEYRANQSQR